MNENAKYYLGPHHNVPKHYHANMNPFGSALSFSFSILKKLGLSGSCFKFQLLGKQFCVFSSS